MDKLQNMSVPSRSSVTAIVEPVSKVYVFDPLYINLILKIGEDENLVEHIKKYINYNPKWDSKIKKPKSYMVLLGNKSNIDILHDSEECDDINLIIYVMSKTFGNLYIPNKNPVYEDNKFDHKLYFLKNEVFNGQE